MTMMVRKARPEDARTIVDFQLSMAAETEGLALDEETVEKGVAAVLADPAKGEYWVAEAEGSVVGSLLTVPEWSDWRNGTVLWIHSVYVSPAARRKGVYRALYAHLKARVMESENLMGLRLYVDASNQAAQMTYAALGMDGEHYRLFEWMKQ